MNLYFLYYNFCNITDLFSNLSGVVQYYSYKPIKIGQELLLFYGDEYFSDLGYDISRQDSSDGK